MKIIKWKSISQWKPALYTLAEIEIFICNNWKVLPIELQRQINFTILVQEKGLLNSRTVEKVFRFDQLTKPLTFKAKVRMERNQFLKTYAEELLNNIKSYIVLSKDNPSSFFPSPSLIKKLNVTDKYPVHIGMVVYSMDVPATGDRPPIIWLYKGDLYLTYLEKYENYPSYSLEQYQLLIFEFYDRDRKKWEELKRKYKSDDVDKKSYYRERIPEDVRIAVWRRDGGKCAKCGSREKLEYDHILPISRGGNNTARNIELLCEKCNREKSNHIE